MTKERALQLIAESFETLKGTDMLEEDVSLNSEISLLGTESPLDSIGFVTFVTELEERVVKETNKDLYLVLGEISEFNIDNPQLTVDALAQYIVNLSEGEHDRNSG